MFDLLNRFWIQFPLCYALTVGGLVTGYRRGGVPPDALLWRAIRAGLPVMLGVLLTWGWIIGRIESGLDARSPIGLQTLLGIAFLLSASALIGAVLARGKPLSILKRGTTLLDETEPASTPVPPDALTLAGHPIPPSDETSISKSSAPPAQARVPRFASS